ncbi:MAG: cytochrome c maturation protein CcmE [Thermodesulfobacteriota bacterium]
MKKSTRKALAGVLVIAAGVGFLIYRGIATTSAYYLTVAELTGAVAGPRVAEGDYVRVGGEVVDGTIDYDQKDLVLRFALRDLEGSEQTVAVRYDGPKPDAFAPDIEVLAEGTFARAEGLFRAQNLLVKCPSKYQSEQEK